jgi:hypothetical protein
MDMSDAVTAPAPRSRSASGALADASAARQSPAAAPPKHQRITNAHAGQAVMQLFGRRGMQLESTCAPVTVQYLASLLRTSSRPR